MDEDSQKRQLYNSCITTMYDIALNQERIHVLHSVYAREKPIKSREAEQNAHGKP